jgi:hypothetical protein
MRTKKVNGQAKKTAMISFRADEQLKNDITKMADKKGLLKSEYIIKKLKLGMLKDLFDETDER